MSFFAKKRNTYKKSKMTHTKSQTWSMDVMLAVVIFIGTILIFYSTLTSNKESSVEDLQTDAAKILESIASEDPDIGIMNGSILDDKKLEELLGEDYELIKEKIRVKSDFCIYIEDENGNILYIAPGQPGIGSPKIQISTIPCA